MAAWRIAGFQMLDVFFFFSPLCRYNRIAREWTQKYAMWCWLDTLTNCLFSHVSDTVARPYFSICLLWRHNPSFMLKQECRPALGLSTLQSLEMDLVSLTDTPPLSARSHFTTRHACMTTVILSEPLGEWMSLGCSAFFGALLLECMQSQENRSDVVHQWEIGTDFFYIVLDCKDLQHSDQLLAQPFTAVTTLKYNSLDWLKYLFKVLLLFPFNKDA